MSKVTGDCEICNELGLHLRAAAAFVKLAEGFKSTVTVERGVASANGKSIIALVTLAAPRGTSMRVSAEGPDAKEAVNALVGLVQDRFGEDA